MILENIMKEFVLTEVERQMAILGFCACERCKLDVAAIVLNQTPPRYVVTSKGELLAQLAALQNQQNLIDIHMSIISAAKFVNEHPRHDSK